MAKKSRKNKSLKAADRPIIEVMLDGFRKMPKGKSIEPLFDANVTLLDILEAKRQVEKFEPSYMPKSEFLEMIESEEKISAFLAEKPEIVNDLSKFSVLFCRLKEYEYCYQHKILSALKMGAKGSAIFDEEKKLNFVIQNTGIFQWGIDKNINYIPEMVLHELFNEKAICSIIELPSIPSSFLRLPHKSTLFYMGRPEEKTILEVFGKKNLKEILVSEISNENITLNSFNKQIEGAISFMVHLVDYGGDAIEQLNPSVITILPDTSFIKNVEYNVNCDICESGRTIEISTKKISENEYEYQVEVKKNPDWVKGVTSGKLEDASDEQVIRNAIYLMERKSNSIKALLCLSLYFNCDEIDKRALPAPPQSLYKSKAGSSPKKGKILESTSIKRYVIAEAMEKLLKDLDRQADHMVASGKSHKRPHPRRGHYRNVSITERHEKWVGEKTGEKGLRQTYIKWINPTFINAIGIRQ